MRLLSKKFTKGGCVLEQVCRTEKIAIYRDQSKGRHSYEVIIIRQSTVGDPNLLQREGAQVFFQAYSESLRQEQLPAGIPLHDGWIFAAEDDAQVTRVKGIFQEVGSDLLGQEVLVTGELLDSAT